MANRALGADGRVTAEMRDWPVPIMDVALLAALYYLVECLGRWPEVMRLALVAMLAEQGAGALKDFRPIVRLSIIYRVWATNHGGRFREWMRRNGVIRQAAGSGAGEQAYDLAMQLALARVRGEALSGVAVDRAKCSAHAHLSTLESLAKRTGIPDAFWGPAPDMYKAPRALRLGGLVGQPLSPSCCITPSCPVASEWLALLLFGLARALSSAAPATRCLARTSTM